MVRLIGRKMFRPYGVHPKQSIRLQENTEPPPLAGNGFDGGGRNNSLICHNLFFVCILGLPIHEHVQPPFPYVYRDMITANRAYIISPYLHGTDSVYSEKSEI